ncbi:MAG TPA: hypothetical protein VFG06_12365 [Thermodesulfovibrionales bacterium]|nr:hypothetical protein [Thermodesulfovibrionales bacterium]
MIIRRYFSEEVFKQIKTDFKFLTDKIPQSGFEYDLQIRDGYFNIYYKGNSLCKVAFSPKTGLYRITIHHRFVEQRIKDRFKPKEGNYLTFSLPQKQLHPLFSQRNLISMSQRVKAIRFQEEIIFEQMIMTDNVDRKDFIIIDRQIMDKTAKTKMDLLALVQKEDNNYQFCVIEVKLGNNPELRGDVMDQLKGYTQRLQQHFQSYKECYELNFRQKQELRLIDKNVHMSIVPGVLGIIVILGYSGLAQKNIARLKEKDPSIKILPVKNLPNFHPGRNPVCFTLDIRLISYSGLVSG